MILLYLLIKNFYTALVFPLKTPEKNTFRRQKKYNSKCLYFDSSHKYSSKNYNFLTIQNNPRRFFFSQKEKYKSLTDNSIIKVINWLLNKNS